MRVDESHICRRKKEKHYTPFQCVYGSLDDSPPDPDLKATAFVYFPFCTPEGV